MQESEAEVECGIVALRDGISCLPMGVAPQDCGRKVPYFVNVSSGEARCGAAGCGDAIWGTLLAPRLLRCFLASTPRSTLASHRFCLHASLLRVSCVPISPLVSPFPMPCSHARDALTFEVHMRTASRMTATWASREDWSALPSCHCGSLGFERKCEGVSVGLSHSEVRHGRRPESFLDVP